MDMLHDLSSGSITLTAQALMDECWSGTLSAFLAQTKFTHVAYARLIARLTGSLLFGSMRDACHNTVMMINHSLPMVNEKDGVATALPSKAMRMRCKYHLYKWIRAKIIGGL